mmetsp:Transcript_2648/g.10345  ORF Transcript_2648/g.10345 Transcript_2648/m.10345 type:complete len:101 (+) Transcript_2648:2656-2958(+)
MTERDFVLPSVPISTTHLYSYVYCEFAKVCVRVASAPERSASFDRDAPDRKEMCTKVRRYEGTFGRYLRSYNLRIATSLRRENSTCNRCVLAPSSSSKKK